MSAGGLPRWLVWLLPALAVLATGTSSSQGSDAERRPPLLSLERQVKEAGDSVTFNARGTELALCDGTTVKILDAGTLARKKRYEATGDRVAFALGDTALVVSGIFFSKIELLDRASGEAKILDHGTRNFQYHSKLDLLAYPSHGRVHLYDLGKKKAVRHWDIGDEDGVARVGGFSPAGSLLAYYDGFKLRRTVLFVVHPPYDKPPATMDSDVRVSFPPVLSPDGKRAALSVVKGPVEVWDLGKKSKVFLGGKFDGSVSRLAFSPDGKLLACLVSKPGSGEVVIWRATDFREVARVRAHGSDTKGMAFSPDGKRLVTASRDGWLKVWKISKGDDKPGE